MKYGTIDLKSNLKRYDFVRVQTFSTEALNKRFMGKVELSLVNLI